MTLVDQGSPSSLTSQACDQEIQRQHDLFGQECGLTEILDAMPNMVAILNENRQVVLANTLLIDNLSEGDLRTALGSRPGELASCPNAINSVYGCGTGVSCQTCGTLKAILTSQSGQSATEECTLRPVDQLETLDIEIKATPLEIQGEQFTIFAIKNIAQKKMARILERTFFHDILNSAGGLLGLATLLDDAEDMTEVQEYAPLMAIQSEQLVAAIESQRDLMAAERGDLQVATQTVGSLTMIQAAMDLYRGHEVAEGKTIQRDEDAARMILTTSKTLLQRTLGNMLKNALEASRAGEVVTIGCEDVSGETCFWVHNPAVMATEVQPQIFNRSFSTKGSGRGLGTYSIKLLGEKYLGGKVSFTSQEGEGTTFRIHLPRSDSPT